MKFICTKDNLLTGLSHVTPLAGKNHQLPILSHVLCQVREGVLHLTCTDLELGVHTTVAGKIENEGGFTTGARKLFEFIQQLPSANPLYLTVDKGRLTITTEGFTAHFPIGEVEEFPLLPTAPDKGAVTLPAAKICAGLQHTIFSAAKEETRPEIHSVFFQATQNEIRLAATDSFRLSEEIIKVDEPIGEFSFLLPLATAQEIVRLFSEQETVTLIPHENYLTVESEGMELSSRLVEGTYPDYRHIIPTSYRLDGTVDRDAFIRALKTVAIFLPRDSRRIQVQFMPEEEMMRVKVLGTEMGEGEVVVPFKGTGDAMEALFNVQYLLDGLQHSTSSECQIQCSGSTEPTLLRPVDTDRQYLYVVMPIQA